MPYRLVAAKGVYADEDQSLFPREQLEMALNRAEGEGYELVGILPEHQDDMGKTAPAYLVLRKPTDRVWGS